MSWRGKEATELTIWIDFNNDDEWSDDEIVANKRLVEPGIEVIDFEIPKIWVLRARLNVAVRWRSTHQIGEHDQASFNSRLSILSLKSSSTNSCSWEDGFHQSDLNGPSSDMVVFDDGNGPALYVASSNFNTAGSLYVGKLAKWDGSHWSSLGAGTSLTIDALAVFDDGLGPALYAGGTFTEIGGVAANNVAKWDGNHWAPLGVGVGNTVEALKPHDDGSGEALFVGGLFSTAGGISTSGLAKWNGSTWSAVGGGVPSGVYTIEEFGTGPNKDLYIGTPYDYWGYYVKKWDGTSWSGVGGGMNGWVKVLTVFDDGTGEALYAGGRFTNASGSTVNHVAKWTGSQWAALGSGTNDFVNEFCQFGNKLFVSGNFTSAGGTPAQNIATWDGSVWSEPRGDAQSVAGGPMAVFDDGGGQALFVSANVTDAAGRVGYHMARFRNDSWKVWLSQMGDGIEGTVRAITVADLGDGPALFVGGDITLAGGTPVNNIAKWDGISWHPLRGGTSDKVRALVTFDDGTGPAVFAGGDFLYADGIRVEQLAKWDGTSWTAAGGGARGQVFSLAVFDDGNGSALYVGGLFTQPGSLLPGGPIEAHGIARWDGNSWSELGTGTTGTEIPYAMIPFDDGNGKKLYVGGRFSNMGGLSVNNIASWNGMTWSAVGSGTDDTIFALEVYDDGQGAKLYAGGKFSTAGGQTVHQIASWDGSVWAPLGDGISFGQVYALSVFDDGTSPVLVVGSDYSSVGGPDAGGGLAKWDGTTWSGFIGGPGEDGPLNVKVIRDASNMGPRSLFIGGYFPAVDTVAASNIASWSCTCSSSTDLTANEWQMIGLPCSPTGTTIGDIFGDDLAQADYDSRWVMYEWDRASEQYTKLGLSSALHQGPGYWIRTLDGGQTIDVDGRATATSCSESPAFSVVGCFSETLNGSSAGRWNMIGHPLSYTVNWGDVRFVDDSGNEWTPSEAEIQGVASKNMYTWNGSAYQTWDDLAPGMLGTLGVFEGQWVKAFPTATALRIPAMPASGGTTAPARNFEEGEWLIRLTATSGDLSDPGNVFGQLAGSTAGLDTHDLPELAPFSTKYLTVVFPHPKWQTDAWAYTTDFHGIRSHLSPGTDKGRAQQWQFEIRSGTVGNKVSLSWQGPNKILKRSILVDLTSGRRIRPTPGDNLEIKMTTPTHRFKWIVLPIKTAE